MTLVPCWLTNQTGAIIRFRPSQLGRLPKKDVNIHVALFDGKVVPGRYHLHPANPYVAGPDVRHFIQSRVEPRSREQALIDIAGTFWRLYEAEPIITEVRRHGVSGNRAASGSSSCQDIEKILSQLDSITEQEPRIGEYRRLLRPAGLRRMLIGLMGASCQIEGCKSAENAVAFWGIDAAGLAVIEVHHIEEVAKRVDHTPGNLCVLCANHHGMIHGLGPWSIRHEGDDVILTCGGKSLRIIRNLSFLRG